MDKKAQINDFAVWTTKYINDLPDSSFLYIESGGKKDGEGKTTPRALRHFPYKDASGKIDLPHLRNAIARIPQSNLPENLKKTLQNKAKAILDKEKEKRGLSLYGLEYESKEFQETSEKQRFAKDIMRVGKYTHPIAGWTLNVDTARMDKWIAAFRKMRANGIDIEVVKDHSARADDVVGYLVDMYRKDDVLYGVHELIGESSIDLARRVKNVSVSVISDFVDGKGNHYGEAIVHSAIVQRPVVPNQEPFIQIAASSLTGSEYRQVEFLQRDNSIIFNEESNNNVNNSNGDNEMNELIEQLSQLIGKELDEKTAIDGVKSYIDELKTSRDEANKKLSVIESQQNQNGNDKQIEIDPDALEMLAESAEEKFNSLVEKGKITPVVAKKLKGLFIGDKGQYNLSMLSKRFSNSDKSIVKQVVEILEENQPVVNLSSKTGVQVLNNSLAQDTSKDTEQLKKEKEELLKEMSIMAGVDVSDK